MAQSTQIAELKYHEREQYAYSTYYKHFMERFGQEVDDRDRAKKFHPLEIEESSIFSCLGQFSLGKVFDGKFHPLGDGVTHGL
ncbi:MAG: hypothetical protein IGR92_09810 [Leptolyngbyaceae cyanobacterium T60_A2020_046]|nr:hypothetical protein [Leptolyngbyaceae cyanobacterium T60_A2020_046]